MRRHTPLKRTGRVRPRNAKRHAKNWTRAYGSPERCDFVAGLPCAVPMCPRRPSENAHAISDGIGRKADADFILPLCRRHHASLHEIGVISFQRMHGISLADCAKRTEEQWRRECAA